MNTSNDPFARAADTMISAPRKAVLRGVETRAARKRQKELDDREILLREWQKWHRERERELLAGPWSEAAIKLCTFLTAMGPNDAEALIALIERGPWRQSDSDTRFLVLELVSHAIMYLRERELLPPFDDPLPFNNEDLNAFLIIREHLR